MMMMHNALNPRDDVSGQYVSRNEERRGLTDIENTADESIRVVEGFTKERKSD